jgi:hypothetical protein
MTIVTLYEDFEGKLFLHLHGTETLWCMNERTASTFLTDAIVVANDDTALHPSIFFFHIPWDVANNDPKHGDIGSSLRPIAALKIDPTMGERGAAYTLFRRW